MLQLNRLIRNEWITWPGYKKSTLERQSLRRQDGQRFIVCKNLSTNQETLSGNSLNVKLWWMNVPSSTEHEISKRFRESVTFRPSGSSALKTDLILSWKSLPGLRNTSRNHCLNTAHRNIHRCRLKLHQAEKQPHDPETLPSPLDQSSLKWTEAKRKLFCGQMDRNLMLRPPD